ncbi:hypothetical protein [Zooshikella sp. RANM57]|uniref:hypothetical protein n=1 Tax=Zooshikella sp. RANM57 TaxID=3425863 RepID=UPI003D6F9354
MNKKNNVDNVVLSAGSLNLDNNIDGKKSSDESKKENLKVKYDALKPFPFERRVVEEGEVIELTRREASNLLGGMLIKESKKVKP